MAIVTFQKAYRPGTRPVAYPAAERDDSAQSERAELVEATPALKVRGHRAAIVEARRPITPNHSKEAGFFAQRLERSLVKAERAAETLRRSTTWVAYLPESHRSEIESLVRRSIKLNSRFRKMMMRAQMIEAKRA